MLVAALGISAPVDRNGQWLLSETEDLRKRLERLGVRLGVQGLRPQPAGPSLPQELPAPPRDAIEDWVSGRIVETEAGPCFLSEIHYPAQHRHGELALGALLEYTPAALASLAGEIGELQADFRQFAFLDTETTGLAGGTGTYAFLVGLGTFEEGEFVVRQYFMRDIPEERAMLGLVCEVLAGQSGLVTFNGRAFDWPLLETRFAMNRQPLPHVARSHLDLLLPARRLWRLRLPSCALSALEAHILNVSRSEDDVPGWAIPGLYRDYLTWGRAEPLRRVFYHNAHDILSLATLAALLCQSMREPLQALKHGEDLFSLGRHFEALGESQVAVQLYQQCLRCNLAPKTRGAAMHRLSHIHRRAGQPQEAVILWHALAEKGDLVACVELAKYYEHRARDLAQAHSMATRALSLLRQLRYPDRRQVAEVEHRLRRLEAKAARRRAGESD